MRKFIKTTIVAAMLGAVATTTAFAGAGHCVNGSKRSLNSNTPAKMNFRVVGENDETQVKIYWLDQNGSPVLYKHAFAGETFRVNTYMTHPWLVTWPEPGGGEACGNIYMPRNGTRTITLG